MSAPVLVPTQAQAEIFGGVTYHIDGELVPVLAVDVNLMSVYFEHHVLLWKHPGVSIDIRPMAGALKRMIAGMQIFVTEASGRGQIAFSRDGTGHILAIHMNQGDELHVREHQFLAATANIDYDFERVRGVANILFGGTGFLLIAFMHVMEAAFYGYMAMETFSRSNSSHMSRSTSNPEGGCTRTRMYVCRQPHSG